MTADRITALEERVAFAMWKAEADRAAPNVGRNRTADMFAEASADERARWLSLARAALAASRAAPDCHQPDLVTAAQVRVTVLEQTLKYIADMKPHHAGQSGNEYRMQQAAKAVLAVCPICDIAGCQHVRGQQPKAEAFVSDVQTRLQSEIAALEAEHGPDVMQVAIDNLRKLRGEAPAVEPVAWKRHCYVNCGLPSERCACHNDTSSYAPTAQDAALVPEIAALIEAHNLQIAARARHWLRRNLNWPEDADVEAVCEKYGYGAVMDAASRLWARKPYGFGAFYIGGCIGFSSDEDAIAALRAIGGDA